MKSIEMKYQEIRARARAHTLTTVLQRRITWNNIYFIYAKRLAQFIVSLVFTINLIFKAYNSHTKRQSEAQEETRYKLQTQANT